MDISEFLSNGPVSFILGIAVLAYIISRVFETPAYLDSPASVRRLRRLPDDVRTELKHVHSVITTRHIRSAYAAVKAAREASASSEYRNEQARAVDNRGKAMH